MVKQSHIEEYLREPIFIFQMGKVGSSSLRSTLAANHRGLVVHAHKYAMLTKKQKWLLRWRMRLKLPVKVICPVRDPLSRNISSFFQNFKRDTGVDFGERNWSNQELLELFLRFYNHADCLDWFDRHLRTTFGVDVLSVPFPIQEKWGVYRQGAVDLLVYRSDLGHAKQLEIVSQFTKKDIRKWNYNNISAGKDYGDIYKKFVASVKLPRVYTSIVCGSAFCRTFWSDTEIDAMKKRYGA
ncbi:Putative capsular polysaccharide synthesis protein [Stieleria neptunia]|uniref:Capsular polysaccharide synthesis protein n=1 Tax=Stieleria neptunia TaxID=2527979 RepID=A0A518HQV8_9BACT|nr:putative capsular polysaccharide synthesis family protein [Stieleria neptunia]QDV43235.1 Putative capsular polysaccharide synthesis protein [Stieleria neptunia]